MEVFYEKKFLLAIFITVYFWLHVENLETYHTPSAINKGKKLVRLINFPIDFEGRVTKDLEKKGWDVYTGNTGNQAIEVGLYNLKLDILGYGTGYLKFTDLRTGKEFARYKFRIADPDNVQKRNSKDFRSYTWCNKIINQLRKKPNTFYFVLGFSFLFMI